MYYVYVEFGRRFRHVRPVIAAEILCVSIVAVLFLFDMHAPSSGAKWGTYHARRRPTEADPDGNPDCPTKTAIPTPDCRSPEYPRASYAQPRCTTPQLRQIQMELNKTLNGIKFARERPPKSESSIKLKPGPPKTKNRKLKNTQI